MPDSEIHFFPTYYEYEEGEKYLKNILLETNWRQDKINLYGKIHNVPRLTAWYGDEGKSYTYSGIEMIPVPWTQSLLEMKNKIQSDFNIKVNSVLINYYRNENDYVAWHSDDEKELGQNPTIASLSFGGERRFAFKHRTNSNIRRSEINLTHGSLLLMKGVTQKFWEHSIPKSTKNTEPRINLTFRYII